MVQARKISYKHGVGVRFKTKQRNCRYGHCMGGSSCSFGSMGGLAPLFGWFTAIIQYLTTMKGWYCHEQCTM